MSFRDEEASSIDSTTVRQRLISNEFDVPNDACLHSQVLYIANGCRSNSLRNLPPGNSSKITCLNSVPRVKSVHFNSDEDIISSPYCTSSSIFLLTSKLFGSSIGKSLRHLLLPRVSAVVRLDDFRSLSLDSLSTVCVLGLEKEWIEDLPADRILVNQIREISGISLNILIVHSRAENSCTPSLICSDV